MYYCRECTEKTLFSSRVELWEDHVFEPLLDWSNANLRPTNQLCLFQSENESGTLALIVSSENMDSVYSAEDFVLALPLVHKMPPMGPID